MSKQFFEVCVPDWKAEAKKLEPGDNWLLFRSALKDFKKKKMMEIIKMEYQSGKCLSQLKEYEDQLHAERQATDPKGWMFITVNPKSGVDLKAFVGRTHKYCNRAMFSQVLYAFEQRGTVEDDNIGKGFHCHILACRKKGYKPSKVKINTLNSFKNFIGNEASLDYGGVGVLMNRVNYIIGTKQSADKHAKQSADQIWRKRYDLDPFYRIKLSALIVPTNANALRNEPDQREAK